MDGQLGAAAGGTTGDNRIMVTGKTAVLMGAIARKEVANSCLHAEPHR
jgi:hypothetical protein